LACFAEIFVVSDGRRIFCARVGLSRTGAGGGRSGSQKARRLSEKAVWQRPSSRCAKDAVGELTVDEEEGERSYNLRMVIQLGRDPSIQPVPALNAYLRRMFGNENIRVVTRPKKTDSLEAYIGEEFLGVLFVENENGQRSYIFELPILDVDLDS
jgi:hypothetical protein